MVIKKIITNGNIKTNTYVIHCDETCIGLVIDPGRQCQDVIAYVNEEKINIIYIVNTHTHPDHCCGNSEIHAHFKVPIIVTRMESSRLESMMKAKYIPVTHFDYEYVVDGNVITFGKSMLSVRETPGHTDGSISLMNSEAIFTGDFLTYNVDSNNRLSIKLIKDEDKVIFTEKILPLKALNEEIIVYPGHGPSVKLKKLEREMRNGKPI